MERYLIEKKPEILLNKEYAPKRLVQLNIDETWDNFIKCYHYDFEFIDINDQKFILALETCKNAEIKFDIILDCYYNILFWKAQESSIGISDQLLDDLKDVCKNFGKIKEGNKEAKYNLPFLPSFQSDRSLHNFHVNEFYNILNYRNTYFLNTTQAANNKKNRYSQEMVLRLSDSSADNLEGYYLFEKITSYYLCKVANDVLNKIGSSDKYGEKYYAINRIIKSSILYFHELPFTYARAAMFKSYIDELDKKYSSENFEFFSMALSKAGFLTNPYIGIIYNDMRRSFLRTLLNSANNNFESLSDTISYLNKTLSNFVSTKEHYTEIFNQYNESATNVSKNSFSYGRYVALQEKCFFKLPVHNVVYYDLKGNLIDLEKEYPQN